MDLLVKFGAISLQKVFGWYVARQAKKLLNEREDGLEDLLVLNVLRIIVTKRSLKLFEFLIGLRYEILQVRHSYSAN